MTRLLNRLFVAIVVMVAGAVTVAPSSATASTAGCVALPAATYIHSFTVDPATGAATATITRSSANKATPLCGGGQQFSLVSYFAPSVSFALPQYVYDAKTLTLSGNAQTLTLAVQLPPCYTQVDFVFGPVIDDLRTDNLYGNNKVGSGGAPGSQSTNSSGSPQSAWYNGPGTKGQTCTNPAATAVPKCDGSGTVHLSNSLPYAAAPFTVTRAGGSPASVPVAALGGEDLVIGAGDWPVTVTGDNGFSKTFDWAWPSGVCASPSVEVTPDCVSFVLKLTNPLTNKAVSALVTYGQQTKEVALGKGDTKTVTFPAGTGSATVALVGAPDWTPLTSDFIKPAANCELANTGTNVTTVVVSGAALLVGGLIMVFFVTRHVGRRRSRATI